MKKNNVVEKDKVSAQGDKSIVSIAEEVQKNNEVAFEYLDAEEFKPVEKYVRKYDGDDFGQLFGKKVSENTEVEKIIKLSGEEIVEEKVDKEDESCEKVAPNENDVDEESVKSSYELTVQVEIHQDVDDKFKNV